MGIMGDWACESGPYTGVTVAAFSVSFWSAAVLASCGTEGAVSNCSYDDMVLAFILDRCMKSSCESRLLAWRPPRMEP